MSADSAASSAAAESHGPGASVFEPQVEAASTSTDGGAEKAQLTAVKADATENARAFPLEDCPVCFEPMGGACPIRKLACGHSFHHGCISRWLRQSASCPLCKADAPAPPAPDSAFQVDLSHQEMANIMSELEDIFQAVHACVGDERPIALSGLAYNLCISLGYEDEDELEEAIGGSLADFLTALPHFEVHWPVLEVTESAVTEGTSEARALDAAIEPRATMRPAPAADDMTGPGACIIFTVASRADLWRVVLQGPCADIEIVELEFAIRPRERRRVDTIYNLIASAVFHLGDHVQRNERAGALSSAETAQICDTIDELNALLDVDQPFTLRINDRQGISELKPMEGAHKEVLAAADSALASGVADVVGDP